MTHSKPGEHLRNDSMCIYYKLIINAQRTLFIENS